MSEEEKKAIEWLKKAEFFSERLYAPIILNLIDKQQKEIEKLNFENHMVKKWNEQLDQNCISKDKIRDILKDLDELLEEK